MPCTVAEVVAFDPKRIFECVRCDRLGMVSPKGVRRRFLVRVRDDAGTGHDLCIVCASILTGVRQGVLQQLADTGPIVGTLPEVAGWCPLPGGAAPDDDAVFEALAAAVFQARFRPDVIRRRWPDIRAAFADFALDTVATWPDEAVEGLLARPGMIQNRKRVLAVLRNARALAEVCRRHGSFAAYVASFRGDTDRLVADVDAWAHFVGAPSIRWFLGCCGATRPG
ncbi:MAG: DNA-3-methyladenine glycosylase I [Myxococcota bacterium]